MQNTLTILPSSRAIRHRMLSLKNSNSFLNPIITIGEFLNCILSIKDALNLDADRRNLLLLEASEFKNFSSLEIERNFFTFTQNSSYIFKFLEELSGEEVSIDDIVIADTYGDYEEHLSVLKELYRRYEKICRREGVLESIFLKKEYSLNSDYLKRFKKISFLLEGYLTNFELRILRECSEFINLEIYFEATKYNTKTLDKFINLGFNIEQGYRYIIDISSKKIILKEDTFRQQGHLTAPYIVCKQFSERIEQVAFIKHEIYKMIREGIEPEHIAVIVPDEEFASKIRLFDTESNFNFAMGTPFRESEVYKKLQACIELLDNNTIQNSLRVNRFAGELYELMLPIYHDKYSQNSLNEIVENLLDKEKDRRIIELINRELYSFSTLEEELKTLSMKQAVYIFLQRLMSLSIDDIGGGKITVMGLLESRGISYEGVIIVDFNDSYVPRSSEKDLFLNTSIRKHSGLPTKREREDLQKHYYYQLISRAKKVAISYVKSDNAIASRFLVQLGINTDKQNTKELYSDILFKKGILNAINIKEIIEPYDFT